MPPLYLHHFPPVLLIPLVSLPYAFLCCTNIPNLLLSLHLQLTCFTYESRSSIQTFVALKMQYQLCRLHVVTLFL